MTRDQSKPEIGRITTDVYFPLHEEVATNQKSPFTLKSCLLKIRFRKWVSVFTTLMVFSFLVAALNLKNYTDTHKLNRYELSPGDEVLISDLTKDLSSYLCSEYTVITEEGQASVYLLDASHSVKTVKRKAKTIKIKGLPSQSQYRYKSFYLHEGAMLHVRGCQPQEVKGIHERECMHDMHEGHASIMVIRGQKSFSQWLATKHTCDDNEDFAVRHLGFTGGHNCREVTVDIEIDIPGRYFVVVARLGSRNFTGTVNISMERQYHSNETMLSVCYHDAACTLELPYGQVVEILIQMKANLQDPNRTIYLSTKCKYRILFWVAVFGILPLIIIIVAFFTVCLYEKRLVGKVIKLRKIQKSDPFVLNATYEHSPSVSPHRNLTTTLLGNDHDTE